MVEGGRANELKRRRMDGVDLGGMEFNGMEESVVAENGE